MDSLASHNVPLPYLPLVTDMGTQAGYWRGCRRNGKSRTNVRSLVERDISIVVGWEGAVEWNGSYGTPLPTRGTVPPLEGPTRVSSYVTGHATTTHSLETNDRTVRRPVHYPNSFARSDGLERFPNGASSYGTRVGKRICMFVSVYRDRYVCV